MDRCKKLSRLPFLILAGMVIMASGFGQDDRPVTPKVEVGIIEKLGEHIPLDLAFMNESDDTVTLRQLVNRPTVLSFVYFDCPSICGPYQAGISEVIGKVGMKLGTDYQVITISFNPRDTPEKARAKKVNYVQQIPEEERRHWIYLTGREEEIKQITEATGYYFKPTGLDFAHPSALIILSPEGKITRYLFGISFLPFDLKMALIEAQQGLDRPAINKVLQLCFAYDNKSRGYTLQITRIVGAFTVVIAAVILVVLLFFRRKKSAK